MNRPILVPIPKKVEWREGSFNFNGETINLYFDFLFADGFENEIRELEGFTGKYTKISQASDANVLFVKNAELEEEEYEIEVDEASVIITASQPVGVFRALTTLKQIYKQCGEFLCIKIYDKPDIKCRQAQFDFRHRIPKLQELKDYVQLLADMKYNEYLLYFESFGFYYGNFPQYYGNERVLMPMEIKELDEFCKERYIKLIPCQASFGHMANWLKHEDIKDLGIPEEGGGGDLNPLDPRSLELVEKIYDCILPYFSADVVHIGFDEVGGLGKGKTAGCGQSEDELFVNFLLKVYDLVTKKYGKKVMFWADMLYQYPQMWDLVPENSTVMLWGYNAYEKYFDKHAPEIDAHNRDFYVCCGTSNWCTFTGKTENALYNIKHAADTVNKHKNAKGILVTDWGDCGNPQFQPISYFGFVAGACYGWNSHNTIASEYDEVYSRWGRMMHDNWVDQMVAHSIQYTAIDYLDKVVFSCNNARLGDILYRMGNYRYIEGESIGNSTRVYELYMGGFDADSINFPRKLLKKISPKNYEHVIKYMVDICKELEAAVGEDDATKLAIEEMKCNVKMVIFMEKVLVIHHYYINDALTPDLIKQAHALADDINELKDEFKSLWLVRNHPKGHEVAYRHFERIAEALKTL